MHDQLVIERRQIGEVGIADELVASLGPAEAMKVVVMAHNDDTVLGHAHVGLDHVRTALLRNLNVYFHDPFLPRA